MDRDLNQFVPQNGMDVVGADGEKVGEIDGVERDYFVVRKGFFFPQDHYIPLTAVSSYDDNAVYLNVTKDEALEQEWSQAPETTTSGDQETVVGEGGGAWSGSDVPTDQDGVVVEDSGRVGQTDEPEVAAYDADRDTLAGIGADRGATADVDRGVTDVDRDDRTINVHEEELVAGTHEVEKGSVRINKDVIEEEANIDVPVTEEEVEISRRRVDREATADDHAFEEGTIEVPLRGEEVDVEKRTRIVEEVDVDKTARQHTEHVSDTVRREEVDIEGDNVGLEDVDRRKKDDGLL